MKEKKSQNITEKNNKIKKVSELLRDNNLLKSKTTPHSVMLSDIEEIIEHHNNDKNKNKKFDNSII